MTLLRNKRLALALVGASAAAQLWACTTVVVNNVVAPSDAGTTPGEDAPSDAGTTPGEDARYGAEGSVLDSAGSGQADAQSAGPWDCLNAPPATGAAGTQVDLSVLVVDALMPMTTAADVDGGSALDIVAGTFLSGAQVRACSDPLDPTCATPAAAPQTTDDAGAVHFPVAGNFNGFFLIDRSDLLPYRFYPGPIPGGVTSARDPIAVVSQAGAQEIVAALGANAAMSFDAGSGMGVVFATVYDCNDHFADGVSFAISSPGPTSIEFYTAGGFPSTSAVHTDKSGVGGLFNVPATSQTIRATAPTGQPLTPVNAVVYPATVTQVYLRARTTH